MMFYGHFCAHGRRNKQSDFRMLWSEVKDETPFRYAHIEIQIWLVTSDLWPTHYQLDHGGTPSSFHKTDKSFISAKQKPIFTAYHNITISFWTKKK